MSRIFTIVTIMLYDFVFLSLGNSLGITVSGGEMPNIPNPEDVDILSGIRDLFILFKNLITFNVEGISDIAIFIFVYIPNIILFLVLLFVLFKRN